MNLESASTACELVGFVASGTAAGLVFVFRDRIPGTIGPGPMSILLATTTLNYFANFVEWSGAPIPFHLDTVEDSLDLLSPLAWWFFFYTVLQSAILNRVQHGEARLRGMLDGLPELVWMSGPDKACTWFNRSWLNYTGRTMEQEVGTGWSEGVHPDDFDRCLAIYSESFDRRESFEMEYRLRNASGEHRWIFDSGRPLIRLDGVFEGYIGGCVDIHDRREAENERSRLLDILQRSRNEIYVLDSKALHFEYVNAGALDNLGYTLDEMRSMTPLDLRPDLTREEMQAMISPLRSGESEVLRFESDHLRANGSRYPVQVHLQLVQSEGDSVFLAVVVDITDRRRQEQQFRNIVETTQEWIWEIDLAGVHTYSNPAIESILGYAVQEVVGSNSLDLMHEQDRSVVRGRLPQLIDGQHGWTGWILRWNHKDSGIRYLESNASPILDENGDLKGFRGADRDVTERIRADRLLRVSEERYRAMTENATEAVVVVDVDSGRFVDFNRKACEMFKASPDRLRELGPAEVSPLHQPDGSPSTDAAMRHILNAVNGAEPVFEWEHRDDHGTLIPCEVRLLRLPDDERRLVRGTVTDISDRKRAEIERESFVTQLEQKNSELERFTYTVSHDLKSPLITIKGFLGLLEEDLANDRAENIRDDITEISGAADRMHRLLEELLELSRIGRVANPVEQVSIGNVVDEAVELLASEIKAAGTQVVIDSDLPTVTGDRVRLVEVLQNLIHNAIRFTSESTQPKIHIGTREQDGESIIYVADNGIGIDPRYQERVFDLFEQLTPDDEGTGIGLSIVKRIVEIHGGWIRIESEGVGHGSTVCFTLEKPSN